MRTELEHARDRAEAMIGTRETRELGTVRPAESVAFAVATAETDPRFLDPEHPAFAVHPMYLPSLLRGPQGGSDREYRADGMFRDEVPGTDGIDVHLMAGGQSVTFLRPAPLGEAVVVGRVIDTVTTKGRAPDEFLLLSVTKTYRGAQSGAFAEVVEKFIVR
ncbi:FAS1-like dehydratase domain-containing protein [Rhodococcus qingshengii]|uniref:FAS1-like dehydratase domain-containing protein n=1 Tax=Rhodococcus qingshengii TaxID=334542 RepID=UPI0021B0A5B5|nr:MaoC family dehydratase N-terminal domain-containing protein [Rhodococcus qingshengii]MCT6732587.1 MaoC family dehydratase N-terminal domain-containing protein [Rhodococcus qingshengii]MDJ0432569.1 MaoC family dehydratase N-terminal domain-containing protein [Rhodococcus qingshengii]